MISGILKGLAVVVAVAGWQLLAHWAMTGERIAGPGRVFAIATVLAVALWLGYAAAQAGRRIVAAALGLGSLALVWTLWASSPELLYLIPHVCAYLFLLGLFGRTLLPGRESLVTMLARRVHGTLPDYIEAYTRRVTLAWCLFFAAMAGTSVLLYALAPLEAWSLFANVLNLPLIVAMFVGEYLYRIWRYPHFSHASILAAVRAFRKFHA